MNSLKPFLWIKNFNPNCISFLHDWWCFKTLLAFKPTYLNMNLELDSLQLSDFTLNIHWNLNAFNMVFRDQINSLVFRFSIINQSGSQHWVWFPKSYNNNHSNMVYRHIISYAFNCEPWNGSKKMWALRVAPRAKHFPGCCFGVKLRLLIFRIL